MIPRPPRRHRLRLLLAVVTTVVGTSWLVAPTAAHAASATLSSISSTPAFAPGWASTAIDEDAPDPDVHRFGSTFYAYTTGTTWGNHIGILQSSAPSVGWNTTTGTPFASSAFTQGAGTTIEGWQVNSTQHAPGVFFWGGKYVMYYAAQTVAGHGGHWCLAVATATSPAGPFTPRSTGGPWLCMDAQGGVIDPSPFIDPAGHAWLYFKTYDDANSSAQPAAIWVAPLSSDGLGVGAPVQVLSQSSLSSPFETVENPQMIYADGSYFLLFARGNWNSSSYREAFAVCTSVLGPCQEGATMLSSYTGVTGPGAGTAFTDAAGHWWFAYHGWNSPCTNYSGSSCGRHLFVAALHLVGVHLQVPCHAAVPDHGYRLVATDGGVFSFGNRQFCGSTGGIVLNKPIVGMASTTDRGGYWFVASDGGIFAFGDARFFGSTGSIRLNKPIVGMAATPDGNGYWLVASDGGIFAFGDARFFGSTGSIRLNKPIVGMAATPSGNGYWLVASDGGIFAFGDAHFYGSTGSIALAKPIVGMTAAPNGQGYWFVASDGGIFSFHTPFYGSSAGMPAAGPVVGMATAPDGKGYWVVTSAGEVFHFGSAVDYGSMAGTHLVRPVVAMS